MDRIRLCKSSPWHNEDFESRSSDSTIDCQSRAYIQPDELICTKLRNKLSQENLDVCIRISKFRELTEKDFHSILEKWLKADDTKSKKRRVSTRLDSANTKTYIFYYFNCYLVFFRLASMFHTILFILLCKKKIKIQFNNFQFTLVLLLEQSTTCKF